VQENQGQDKERSQVTHRATESRDDEINLLNYIVVLLKRKKLIAVVTGGFAVAAVIVSLLLPEIYVGQARIYPQQQNSLSTQLANQFSGGLTGLANSLLGTGGTSDFYAGILQGRTIGDRIIDRFNLVKLYDADTIDDARKKLSDNIKVETDSKSNIISIAVEDKDPKRASDMANACVDELIKLSGGLAVTDAAQRRMFLEEQLKATKDSLSRAEEAMKSFQERTGALQVEEQAKAVIGGIAELRAQIAAKEVEIKVMKTYSRPGNPDLQVAETAWQGMKDQLNRLETKSGGGADPLMPTGRMPSVGLEYMRKLRDVKFNEALYELLTKQNEVAKLDEARAPVVVQVIDKAVPPIKRDRPKRGIIVIISAFTGFLVSVIGAFLIEYVEDNAADPKNSMLFQEIKKHARLRRRK